MSTYVYFVLIDVDASQVLRRAVLQALAPYHPALLRGAPAFTLSLGSTKVQMRVVNPGGWGWRCLHPHPAFASVEIEAGAPALCRVIRRFSSASCLTPGRGKQQATYQFLFIFLACFFAYISSKSGTVVLRHVAGNLIWMFFISWTEHLKIHAVMSTVWCPVVTGVRGILNNSP